ncbi:MAG: hypothetical protein AAGC74_08560 [Verrucomicrobiota bacterium]
MSVQLREVEFRTRWMKTRFPFRYGIAAMVDLPHVFVRVEGEMDGERIEGLASEGLAPKWFTKNAETRFEEDLPELVGVIEKAAELGKGIEGETLFDWWWQLYHEQSAWGEEEGLPPLLIHLGTSLLERAMMDAVCRGLGSSFAEAVERNALGVELGRVHPELVGTEPSDWLGGALGGIVARHTVGLSDPLISGEIGEEDRAGDGMPQALDEVIEVYGVTHFKVKLCGQLEKDVPRMKALARMFSELVPDFQMTLDGNEQYATVADFRAQWEEYLCDDELREFLSDEHLIFVEQPIHRDHALKDEVGEELGAWEGAPPMIIDESDATLTTARRALELGYRGTSHKNCKGVFKGMANRCLIEKKRREDAEAGPWLMSGEDLANVGPVALLNDLAVMATLQIEDVERNGHHYFAGLSVFPEEVQRAVCRQHGTLYQWDEEEGFARLQVKGGRIDLGNLNEIGFGCRLALKEELLEQLGEMGVPN